LAPNGTSSAATTIQAPVLASAGCSLAWIQPLAIQAATSPSTRAMENMENTFLFNMTAS
jgi:hypothetical protein